MDLPYFCNSQVRLFISVLKIYEVQCGRKMKSDNNSMSLSHVNNDDTELFAVMCKALGHPTRVMIINYLKKIDRCLCGEIVELLPLAQSTVSQHLKCLKDAGLIKGEVEGPKTCYCLDKTMLEKFTLMVAALGKSTQT
jgi:DNA-binding transcriptional ArsR family regulator